MITIILQLINQSGKSDYAIEKQLGFTQGTISNWRRNKNKVSTDAIIKLAQYFGVSTDYLLFGANNSIKEGRAASNIYDVDGLVQFEELGSIRAGFNGMLNEEPTGDIVDIPLSMIRGGHKEDYFVLRVVGNSMYPRLLEGDKILCKRCNSVDSGDYAVVLYDGECATVKKVHYVSGENWLELVPINPDYETKRVCGADLEQCRVLGKVVKLIRDL